MKPCVLIAVLTLISQSLSTTASASIPCPDGTLRQVLEQVPTRTAVSQRIRSQWSKSEGAVIPKHWDLSDAAKLLAPHIGKDTETSAIAELREIYLTRVRDSVQLGRDLVPLSTDAVQTAESIAALKLQRAIRDGELPKDPRQQSIVQAFRQIAVLADEVGEGALAHDIQHLGVTFLKRPDIKPEIKAEFILAVMGTKRWSNKTERMLTHLPEAQRAVVTGLALERLPELRILTHAASRHGITDLPWDIGQIENYEYLDVIRAGETARFRMGEPGSQVDVELTEPFAMARGKVSQLEVLALRGWTPSAHQEGAIDVRMYDWSAQRANRLGSTYVANRVATNVSHDDAIEMIHLKNMSARELKIPVTYALPSEAQWEYAYRAGSMTVFPWGDDMSRSAEFAHHSPSSGPGATGWRKPNRWGLHMGGDALEWTDGWWEFDLRGGRNPSGGSSGSHRVVRGGTWNYPAMYLRSAQRNSGSPGVRDYAQGFRLIRH